MIPFFLLLQAAAPASAPAPAWTVQTKAGAAGASDALWVAAFSADRNARLAVRCDRGAVGVVSVQLRTRRPLAAAEDHEVSLTADGGAPVAGGWLFPGGAAYTSDTTLVTQLTTALASAKSTVVTTTDAAGPVSATFAGPADGAGIRQVLEACGYVMGEVPAPLKPAVK